MISTKKISETPVNTSTPQTTHASTSYKLNSQKIDSKKIGSRSQKTGQAVKELHSTYLGSTIRISGLDSLDTSQESKQTLFVCLDGPINQFLNSSSISLNNACVIYYQVDSEPYFKLSTKSLHDHSAFIALELQPYLETFVETMSESMSESISESLAPIVVVGQQFSSVLAAYTAAYYPRQIQAAMSLSGSFYWKPQREKKWEWLTSYFVEDGNCPAHLYLLSSQVDTLEPPRQVPTARMANQNLYNVLKAKGCNVHLKEFNAQPLTEPFMQELRLACEWIQEQLEVVGD